MFDQNPPCILTKLRKNHSGEKLSSQLDLEGKGQGHSKNHKPVPQGTKNMPPKKYEQGFP